MQLLLSLKIISALLDSRLNVKLTIKERLATKLLIKKSIDIAIHSLKDLPTETHENLVSFTVTKRENPKDVLVIRKGSENKQLSDLKIIGTSSIRRKKQIQFISNKILVKSIRGNVETRIKKLDNGEYDGIILAAAGLNRLGLNERVSKSFKTSEITPSAGQGALAVECRVNDKKTISILKKIQDKATEICVSEERKFLKTIGGGCSSPDAVLCSTNNDKIEINGKVYNKKTDEYGLFLKYSKEIGMDPTMIQAAGGNTSLKQGNTMWVKASGKWLCDAQSNELMVPMSISKIKEVLEDKKCSDTDISSCINLEISPLGLRPSVEAPMHAVLDFKFVFHTHDININALAVQKNSKLKFEEVLLGLNWKFIPYLKPGIELCRELIRQKTKNDNVFILENHGLIVCGQSLEEVQKLNHEVRFRLKKLQGKIFYGISQEIDKEVNLKNTGYK